VRRLTIVLAASALLLAGCGGGGGGSGGSGVASKPSGPPLTKAQYQAKLKQIAKDVSTSLGSTSNSKKKVSKADVDKFVKALHSFADQLAQINPPAGIKALHTRLVGAMNDLADEFPGITDKLNNAKDASTAIAALFGAKAIQELSKLATEFKAKGYVLSLNG
jgi:hypothetical protein